MLADETDSDPELALLAGNPADNDLDLTGEANHALKTAPILTGDAYEAVGSTAFPQRALYGRILESSTGAQIKSPKLFININAPFSGIVCGVQGSGKSHSTSVLLESCLIRDKRLGTLPEPLSALLFHFDTAAGAGEVRPCEAAYIASLELSLKGDAVPPNVVVLVPANNIKTMRRVYSGLPSVKVEPLHFAPEDLNGDRLLAMMKIDQDQHRPLYMECIMAILRDMEPFSYEAFLKQLKEQKFAAPQKAMLDQRLSILNSCLEGGNEYNRVTRHFRKGQLTIIDLSAPFMDASSACGFFDMILGLFSQAPTEMAGKLVVLDEAHKYLTSSGSSSRLTDSLLSVIRQQRHLGTRVLISTQEPTVVPPSFLDLCSFVIAHRFSSPKWLDHLKEHISVGDAQWCSKVITLRAGDAMIFAPAALVLRQVPEGASPETAHSKSVAPLGQGHLKVRSRARITADGGRSVLAAVEPSLCGPSTPGSMRSLPVGSSVPAIAEPSLYGQSVPGLVMSRPVSAANSVQSLSPWSKNEGDVDQERSSDPWAIGSSQAASWPKSGGFRASDDPNDGNLASLPALPDSDGIRSPPPNRTPGRSSGTPATAPGMSADATSSIQSRNSEVVTPQGTIIESLASSEPRSNIVPGYAILTQGQASTASTRTPDARFRPLVLILKTRKKNEFRVSFSELGTELKKFDSTLYKKLKDYLMEAEDAGIVEIGGTGGDPWVQLLSKGESKGSQSYQPDLGYSPLVKVMKAFLSNEEKQPRRSVVAEEIYRSYPGTVAKGKFGQYILGALEACIVVRRKHDRLELVV